MTTYWIAARLARIHWLLNKLLGSARENTKARGEIEDDALAVGLTFLVFWTTMNASGKCQMST
eukprot:822922-Prorocentrum_lima.AAC.1